MIITYDEDTKAACIFIKPEGAVIQSIKSVDDRVLLHYDDQGEVCSISVVGVEHRPVVCLVTGAGVEHG